jgi:hypothetical protein
MNSHQTALPFIPTTIIKKRILKGVQSFEVKWKDNQGLLCNLELAKQLLVTTEPQEMFRTAYPDLVEEYMKEKEAKSRKGEQCYISATMFIIYSVTLLQSTVSCWWVVDLE